MLLSSGSKRNNISQQLPPSYQGSLYVDDLQISCKGWDIKFIEWQVQIAVNGMTWWCTDSSFSFSANKTCYVHCCWVRGCLGTQKVSLAWQHFIVNEVMFLWVFFNKKLMFFPHVLHCHRKCEWALCSLNVLSNTSWGGIRPHCGFIVLSYGQDWTMVMQCMVLPEQVSCAKGTPCITWPCKFLQGLSIHFQLRACMHVPMSLPWPLSELNYH